jgi:hypothetical protein
LNYLERRGGPLVDDLERKDWNVSDPDFQLFASAPRTQVGLQGMELIVVKIIHG